MSKIIEITIVTLIAIVMSGFGYILAGINSDVDDVKTTVRSDIREVTEQIKRDHDLLLVMQRDIEILMEDEQRDDAQDEKIKKLEDTKRKHWRLHRWIKEVTNGLENYMGLMELSKWPELGDVD